MEPASLGMQEPTNGGLRRCLVPVRSRVNSTAKRQYKLDLRAVTSCISVYNRLCTLDRSIFIVVQLGKGVLFLDFHVARCDYLRHVDKVPLYCAETTRGGAPRLACNSKSVLSGKQPATCCTIQYCLPVSYTHLTLPTTSRV